MNPPRRALIAWIAGAIASGGLCIAQTTVGAYGSNASSTSSKRVSGKS